jgi:hypothetical protein
LFFCFFLHIHVDAFKLCFHETSSKIEVVRMMGVILFRSVLLLSFVGSSAYFRHFTSPPFFQIFECVGSKRVVPICWTLLVHTSRSAMGRIFDVVFGCLICVVVAAQSSGSGTQSVSGEPNSTTTTDAPDFNGGDASPTLPVNITECAGRDGWEIEANVCACGESGTVFCDLRTEAMGYICMVPGADGEQFDKRCASCRCTLGKGAVPTLPTHLKVVYTMRVCTKCLREHPANTNSKTFMPRALPRPPPIHTHTHA